MSRIPLTPVSSRSELNTHHIAILLVWILFFLKKKQPTVPNTALLEEISEILQFFSTLPV